MTEQERKEMKLVFAEGFQELVLPRLEIIDDRLEHLEDGVGRMELMLQQVVRDVDDHGVRITKLEKSFGK